MTIQSTTHRGVDQAGASVTTTTSGASPRASHDDGGPEVRAKRHLTYGRAKSRLGTDDDLYADIPCTD